MCWFIALCMMFCRVEVVSWPDALHLMGQTQGADLSSLVPSTSILQCTDGVNHVTNKSHFHHLNVIVSLSLFCPLNTFSHFTL